jgi:N-terminal acetyltransferase B complex catalytic subunit
VKASQLIKTFLYIRTVMGKAEGHATNWHGHVTALSVAPDYRRLGLAAKLMFGLEEISEK